MWHEARKHEKKIRGIMVDHKRRAERRKQYYEKIKKDPAQFLQIWGRQCKIHIDASIASAGDNPSIMTTWRGDNATTIDRFDVRSHLDVIDEYKSNTNNDDQQQQQQPHVSMTSEIDENRMCNYERYRTLVLNDALDIGEEQCLKQIDLDEKYGSVNEITHEKKGKGEAKAQIGYVYEDGVIVSSSSSSKQHANSHHHSNKLSAAAAAAQGHDDDDFDELEEDLDIQFDFIDKLDADGRGILNKCGVDYGLIYGDYVRMMQMDQKEREEVKKQKEIEAYRAQFSGRKSRRERRIEKEKYLRNRELSPLSFIAKESPKKEKPSDYYDEGGGTTSDDNEKSRRSRSPIGKKQSTNQQIFITSFGSTNELNEENEFNDNYPTTQGLVKIPNKQQTLIKTVKLLKRDLSQSPKLRASRSRSKTPQPQPQQQRRSSGSAAKRHSRSSSSSSSASSASTNSSKSKSNEELDEAEALKEYLKRKQNRLQKSSSSNLNSSIKVDSKTEEIKKQKEIMKKKMLRQITKQFKKDKEVEREKRIKDYEDRKQREAQLQYLNDKLRERRRKERGGRSSSDSRSRSRSRSGSRSRDRKRRRRSSSSSSRRSRSRRQRSRSSTSTSSSSSSSSSRSRSRNRRKRSTSATSDKRDRRQRRKSRSRSRSHSKSARKERRSKTSSSSD